MTHSSIDSGTQAGICIVDKIDDFFKQFDIASILHQCGIRKRHGYCVRSLIKIIFTLPFVGKYFFRGIVVNQELAFDKDAAYELLKGRSSNWRRLLLILGLRQIRGYLPESIWINDRIEERTFCLFQVLQRKAVAS